MSKILLVAPTYMSIYEDIRSGLKEMGNEVQFYPDKRIEGDPFNRVGGGKKKKPVSEFIAMLDSMWSNILDKDANDCFYDYLLVIDGLSVPSSLFDRLRKVNPSIVTCNYLYDRVKGVYELDRNFKYYNRVFSFDQQDCRDYKLSFLPIYWTPTKRRQQFRYDVFGFGSYDKIRLNTFRRIRDIVAKEKLSAFIKIYNNYGNTVSLLLRNMAKAIIGREHLPLLDIISGMFTKKALLPSDFKELIVSSNTIVDTNHPFQDGLTARFMWALGAEKKIVTTNCSVRNYPFYSDEQIFILNNNWDELPDFLKSEFTMKESVRAEIAKYRIDNWLDTILHSTFAS